MGVFPIIEIKDFLSLAFIDYLARFTRQPKLLCFINSSCSLISQLSNNINNNINFKIKRLDRAGDNRLIKDFKNNNLNIFIPFILKSKYGGCSSMVERATVAREKWVRFPPSAFSGIEVSKMEVK